MNDDVSAGTAVSTRVRLARNIAPYAFPSKMDVRASREIVRKVVSCLDRLDSFSLYYMNGISPEDAARLTEKHLISPALCRNTKGGAALINNEEFISVMINEEDHLREQCILPGMELSLAYDTMSEIDDILAETVRFAYDEELGFLTACPTNLGTGLRSSVMLFLPALTMNGRMPGVMENAKARGLTVRGIYGEGSRAEGYMYQISNEVTLGLSERDILDLTRSYVDFLIDGEAAEREEILDGPACVQIKDMCLRAYGTVTNCSLMSDAEFSDMCTKIRLGACMGFIPISDVSQIDALALRMSERDICLTAGRKMTESERDAYRAETGGRLMKELTQNK